MKIDGVLVHCRYVFVQRRLASYTHDALMIFRRAYIYVSTLEPFTSISVILVSLIMKILFESDNC